MNVYDTMMLGSGLGLILIGLLVILAGLWGFFTIASDLEYIIAAGLGGCSFLIGLHTIAYQLETREFVGGTLND